MNDGPSPEALRSAARILAEIAGRMAELAD